jgi:head-tail adaptor
MRPGRMNHQVTLFQGPEVSPTAAQPALSPSTWWACVEPLDPTTSDGTRMQASRVTMRYHPQVTLDTFIRYGTRVLYVKGVQNVGDANRELILFCDEVIP